MANCRAEILARLRALNEAGRPNVSGAAGTGLSMKCEDASGIDR
jgi:predicted TIM-barrel enzyme